MSRAAQSESVKVILRVRPTNKKQRELNYQQIVEVDQKNSSVILTNYQKPDQPQRTAYKFDSVADEQSSQQDILKRNIQPLISDLLNGYNATIFAYGQTGSGKTYTMTGDTSGKPENRDKVGIIPRLQERIIEMIKEDKSRKYILKQSFVEVLNNKVYNLSSNNKNQLEIRERQDQQQRKIIFLEGIDINRIQTLDEFRNSFINGLKFREIGVTTMNTNSSRSHTIFTIYIESEETYGNTTIMRSSKLHLVDLGGTQYLGDQRFHCDNFKQSVEFNKSLFTLKSVIEALKNKSAHVPYRDSTLTTLLSDSLGGNSKTLMIATISPTIMNQIETTYTLEYAKLAKQILNKAEVNIIEAENEQSTDDYLKKFLETNAKLERQQRSRIKRQQEQKKKLKEQKKKERAQKRKRKKMEQEAKQYQRGTYFNQQIRNNSKRKSKENKKRKKQSSAQELTNDTNHSHKREERNQYGQQVVQNNRNKKQLQKQSQKYSPQKPKKEKKERDHHSREFDQRRNNEISSKQQKHRVPKQKQQQRCKSSHNKKHPLSNSVQYQQTDKQTIKFPNQHQKPKQKQKKERKIEEQRHKNNQEKQALKQQCQRLISEQIQDEFVQYEWDEEHPQNQDQTEQINQLIVQQNDEQIKTLEKAQRNRALPQRKISVVSKKKQKQQLPNQPQVRVAERQSQKQQRRRHNEAEQNEQINGHNQTIQQNQNQMETITLNYIYHIQLEIQKNQLEYQTKREEQERKLSELIKKNKKLKRILVNLLNLSERQKLKDKMKFSEERKEYIIPDFQFFQIERE